MTTVWLSSPRSTFRVDVDDDMVITKAAPICWKWKGRNVNDLIRYFRIDKVEVLNDESEAACL